VPTEYLNAPQPTEVRVGDVVEYRWLNRKNPDIDTSIVVAIEDDRVRYDDDQFDHINVINTVEEGQSVKVTDDSRENIGEAGVKE
jgi:hypothetical protein